MSVRVIIILLALPLFLLLAAANSLLLFREETRDMEAGLRGQALAAVVTVAEFAKASPDPFKDLSQPLRLQSLRVGTRGIAGLDSLYLVRPDRPPLNLLEKPLIAIRHVPVPRQAVVMDGWQGDEHHPQIAALAPAGRGTMVVADVDASPLARRASHLERLSILLVAGSMALAILLGLIIARRVTGEFRRTRTIIEGHGSAKAGQPLGIREVRDLADAIHLIDANVTSELERLDSAEASGDPAIAIAAQRARYLPDVLETRDGIRLSIRTVPGAPAGCFHLHRIASGGCAIALGEIPGDPAQALASAIALRTYVMAAQAGDFEKRLAIAGRAYGASLRVERIGSVAVLALNASPATIESYSRRNPDLDSDLLTADLALLLPGAGIIVASRPV